jgi:DNA-binding beta-propeller fold protein YncE
MNSRGMVLGCAATLLFAQTALAQTFVLKWGSAGSGNGQFSSPYALAVAPNGQVYVADAFNHRVQRFNNTGGYLGQWGSFGTGDGQFNAPTGIAIEPDFGNVYVTSSDNRVQAFTSSGSWIARWGTTGSGNGQFNLPRGIAVGPDAVYVVEQGNQRIQKFTQAGTFLTKWGSPGSGNGQFNNPWGIALDAAGNVYVSETNNNRIQVFDPNGNFLRKWGTAGSGDGQLNNPRGITVDGAGNVYVVDMLNNRIQEFTGTGTFIRKWGTGGSADGQFSSPEDVDLDANGAMFIADTGNQRIQKESLLPIGPPSPATSTCPGSIFVDQSGTSCFDVVVRDSLNNPLHNVAVHIDFGNCSFIPCPNQPSVWYTDAQGLAHICICGCIDGPCTATLVAGNVELCTVPVTGQPCPHAPTSCTNPPPGMLGWWPFDETVTGSARDIAYGNNGTNGPGWTFPSPVSGHVAGAYQFDGFTQAIQVSTAHSLAPPCTESLSIDAWIMPDYSGGTTMALVSCGNRYELQLKPTGQLVFKAGSFSFTTSLSDAIPPEVWTHVAVVLEMGSSKYFSVFTNGTQIGYTPTGPASLNSDPGDLFLGASTLGASPYRGLMDEVEIFGRALDPAEIMAIYNAGSFGKCKCDRLSPDDVVKNGSFECGSSAACVAPWGGIGGLESWTILTPRPDWVGTHLPEDCDDSDNDVIHDSERWNGDRFMFLRDHKGDESIISGLKSPLQVGQQYTLSFWGSTRQQGERGAVHFLFDGTTHRWSKQKKYKKITAPTGQWGFYSTWFEATSAVSSLTVQAEHKNIAVDGVSIMTKSCDCNLVPDPSFENFLPSDNHSLWYTIQGQPVAGPDDVEFASSPQEGTNWAELSLNPSVPFSGYPGDYDAIGAQLVRPLVPGKRYRLSFWLSTGDDETDNQRRGRVQVLFAAQTISHDAANHVDGILVADVQIKGKRSDWQYQEVIFEARQYTDMAFVAARCKGQSESPERGIAVDNVCLVPWPSPDTTWQGRMGARATPATSVVLAAPDPYRHDDLTGDLDGDLDVDGDDLAIMRGAFGHADGDSLFDEEADLDGDGVVTLEDYQDWLDSYQDLNAVAVANRPDTLHALTVVHCVPQNIHVAVGDTATVDIVADFNTPMFGWGLDLASSAPSIAGPVGSPTVGPSWQSVHARDGDGLAGCAFPADVGPANNVLLARVHIRGLAPGAATLTPGATTGDLGEGFAIASTDFSNVQFVPAAIVVTGSTSVPEQSGVVSWLAPGQVLAVRPNPAPVRG